MHTPRTSSQIRFLEEPCMRFLHLASVLLLQVLLASAVPVSAEEASAGIASDTPEQRLSIHRWRRSHLDYICLSCGTWTCDEFGHWKLHGTPSEAIPFP